MGGRFMNKKVKMKVRKVKEIAKDTIEMTLENDYVAKQAKAGQFLHILVDGHTLRRPISITEIKEETNTVTIIFKVIGQGTKDLANYQVGQEVDVLGLGGSGFPTEALAKKTVLLIGGGVGVPPLYFLGKELAKDPSIEIITILGFQSKEYVFYEDKFKAFGETILMTDDGSAGEKGFVTDAIAKTQSFDRFYTCGPSSMLRAVSEQLSNKEGYISLEEYMGCGIGACFACIIQTTDGKSYKKICQDGPVFPANEVRL